MELDNPNFNLLKKVFQLGGPSIIKKNRIGLVEAISKMDMKMIDLILEDERSYQNTSKIIFLEKLNDIFTEFKTEDTNLLTYDGKCCSNECSNTHKKGVLFKGNISEREFNLIIEESEIGTINDIYNCNEFCTTNKDVKREAEEIQLDIYFDEKVDFKPSLKYTYINNKCIEAINQLKNNQNRLINKEEIAHWLNSYKSIRQEFKLPPIFYKTHSKFYKIYAQIKEVHKYLKLEEIAAKALEDFKGIDSLYEKQLLNWLVNNEDLYDSISGVDRYNDREETITSGNVKLYSDYEFYFRLEMIQNCIDFERVFVSYYYEKLDKYDTDAKERIEKNLSLKYHLQKRSLL
jgi:hypothetical protein